MKNCIQGPAEGHQHSGVKDVKSYKEVHLRQMKLMEKIPHENDQPKEAYINHGRWVIDCDCAGAGLTSPDFNISCCFDCGTIYTNIVFPEKIKEIVQILLRREKFFQRNWNKNESLESLEANE